MSENRPEYDGKLRGLLIDPSKQSVTEIFVSCTDDRSLLNSMYALIECDTVECVRDYFARQPFCKQDDLWVDEEALLKSQPVQWGFTLWQDATPIIGKALVLGVDRDKGECKSFTLSPADIAEIKKRISWCYFVNRHSQ